MSYVVGVDIGTQSTKALLCDEHGRIVAQRVRSYRPDTPRPLWAEQWPAVWLDAVIECIAGCVSDAKTRDVRAICISSLYGGSGIPVDERMQPLHPCLIWMDRRAQADVACVDAELIRRRTGLVLDLTRRIWRPRSAG